MYKQERILLAGFSACGGSCKRHSSTPPQCDPCGAFLSHRNEVSYEIKKGPECAYIQGLARFSFHMIESERKTFPICFLFLKTKSSETISDPRAFLYQTKSISSSFIQTILSALELHQIIPFGSRALPPVENFTPP